MYMILYMICIIVLYICHIYILYIYVIYINTYKYIYTLYIIYKIYIYIYIYIDIYRYILTYYFWFKHWGLLIFETKYKLTDNDLNELKEWKVFVEQEVSRTINNLGRNSSFYKTSKILNNENVKVFLYNFQEQIIFVSIHKEAS